MSKTNTIDYLAKVRQLSGEERERLFSRMRDKIDRRLEKRKISEEEALAAQLELEDDQLREWRKMMLALREKEKTKAEKKAKSKNDKKATKKSMGPVKEKKASVKASPADTAKQTVKKKEAAKPGVRPKEKPEAKAVVAE